MKPKKKNIYLSESEGRIIRNLLVSKHNDLALERYEDCESAYEELYGCHPNDDLISEYSHLIDKITKICNFDPDDFNLFDGEV